MWVSQWPSSILEIPKPIQLYIQETHHNCAGRNVTMLPTTINNQGPCKVACDIDCNEPLEAGPWQSWWGVSWQGVPVCHGESNASERPWMALGIPKARILCARDSDSSLLQGRACLPKASESKRQGSHMIPCTRNLRCYQCHQLSTWKELSRPSTGGEQCTISVQHCLKPMPNRQMLPQELGLASRPQKLIGSK